MAKSKLIQQGVPRPKASSLVSSMVQSGARSEGHAIQIQDISAPGSVQAKFGLDVSKAPVPSRNYVSDICWVAHDKFEIRVIFAQRNLVGDGLDSALVIHMSPDAILNLNASIEGIHSPTINELIATLGLDEEVLTEIKTNPTQVANLIANLISVAIAGHETCLDFYHSSAFAIRKSANQTTLDVEPVVRVFVHTSLFSSLAKEIKERATNISRPLNQ